MIRTITDHLKQPHTLDLDAVQVDGQNVVEILAEGDYVLFETTGGTVTCLLEQIWQEVAGPDLTAREAGALLMECLARQIILEHQDAVLRDLSQVLSRLGCITMASTPLNWLTTRIDPLARQAMSAYDGSDVMTEMLARILQREPATIREWARQLGLDASPAQQEAIPETPVALPAPVIEEASRDDASATEAVESRFRWSTERLRQLQTALDHSTAPTLAESAQQIAEAHGWPVEKVQSKLYELRNTSRHTGKPAARESEQAEQKEEDRRVETLETVAF